MAMEQGRDLDVGGLEKAVIRESEKAWTHVTDGVAAPVLADGEALASAEPVRESTPLEAAASRLRRARHARENAERKLGVLEEVAEDLRSALRGVRASERAAAKALEEAALRG